MAAEAQIESMRADVERTTVRLSPTPSGGCSDPAEGILRLMQAKQRCEQTIERYNHYKAHCIELISMVDAEYQRPLTLVYGRQPQQSNLKPFFHPLFKNFSSKVLKCLN